MGPWPTLPGGGCDPGIVFFLNRRCMNKRRVMPVYVYAWIDKYLLEGT